MLTVRQIERWWKNGEYGRLLTELSIGRVEATGAARELLSGPVAAAALAVVRLDELNQSAHPLAGELVRYLISRQATDGTWSDPATTAIAVRALSCSRGHGVAIDRGVDALASVQRPDALWSRAPGHRIAAGDLHVTAFIAVQLVTANVRRGVRLEEALAAIDATDHAAEPGLLRLRAYAARRLRPSAQLVRETIVPMPAAA